MDLFAINCFGVYISYRPVVTLVAASVNATDIDTDPNGCRKKECKPGGGICARWDDLILSFESECELELVSCLFDLGKH